MDCCCFRCVDVVLELFDVVCVSVCFVLWLLFFAV